MGRLRLAIAALLAGCGAYSAAESVRDAGAPSDAAVDDAGASDASGADSGALADADASSDASVGCSGAADCERVVFLTSATFDGTQLGGAAGADAKCTSAAAAIAAHSRVKGRKFRAWISDGMTKPAATFTQGTKPYVTPSGSIVAANWSGFASSSHMTAIDQTELDVAVVPTNANVWTGTTPSGNGTPDNCGGWTTVGAAADGAIGLAGATDSHWTQDGKLTCNSSLRIYCIEE